MQMLLSGSFPITVSDLLAYGNQYFYRWQSEKLGNDLFINAPERAARIDKAAADGGDGSLHCEHIDDMREFAGILYGEYVSALSDIENDEQYGDAEDRLLKRLTKLDDDFKQLEEWHIKNGSYEQEVG